MNRQCIDANTDPNEGSSESTAFAASPYFQSTSQDTTAMQSQKHLPWSSSLFGTLPSEVIDGSVVANDETNKNENDQERSEAALSMQQKDFQEEATTKTKPARVSIGTMMIEGSLHGGSTESSDSENENEEESKDEPIKKKQKANPGTQNEEKDDELMIESHHDTKHKNDKWSTIWEEATTISPMFLGEEDENPYQESILKLEKWTRELLVLKKKLEDARVRTSIDSMYCIVL